MPIEWIKNENGQYYLEKKWTCGAYINGTFKLFSFYWDSFYIDKNGVRHKSGKYWDDPRGRE